MTSERLDDTFKTKPDDPSSTFALFGALGFSWLIAFGVVGLVWLGLWAALRAVGAISHGSFFPVFGFIIGFCVFGGVDATWRYALAWRATERARYEEAVGQQTRNILKLARRNDATLVLQVVAGATVLVLLR